MDINMIASYLTRATKRKRQLNDPLVEEMMKYAKNNPVSNFSIELNQFVLREQDFIRYYRKKCEEPNMVFLHLRALGIRKDLIKHVDEPARPHFKNSEAQKMPRYAISDKAEQFQKLFEMLSHGDESVRKAVWELVCMLATNKKMYDDVLEFVDAQEDDRI